MKKSSLSLEEQVYDYRTTAVRSYKDYKDVQPLLYDFTACCSHFFEHNDVLTWDLFTITIRVYWFSDQDDLAYDPNACTWYNF